MYEFTFDQSSTISFLTVAIKRPFDSLKQTNQQEDTIRVCCQRIVHVSNDRHSAFSPGRPGEFIRLFGKFRQEEVRAQHNIILYSGYVKSERTKTPPETENREAVPISNETIVPTKDL